jgi:outer membrane protein TolC
VPAERDDPEAGEQTALQLSLKEAERLALEYSHALRASRRQREIAEGKILSAWGEALPTVNGQIRRSMSHAPPGSADDWVNQYSGSIQVRQPLYKAGRIGAALRAARLYRANTSEEIRQARQGLLYEVRVLYYQVLLQEELVRVAREQVDLAKRYLEDVRKRRETEVATEYDVLRAEVELTNDQTDYTSAHNNLVNARSAFLRLLGLPLSGALELTDELTYTPTPRPYEKRLYALAMQCRPEVRSSEYDVAMQQEQITATRAELYPQFSLLGEVSRSTSEFSEGLDDWDRDWSLAVVMDWTLFDGFLIRGRIKEQKAVKAQMEDTRKGLRDRVRLEVRQALLDIQSAKQSVESQKRNVDQAREALRLTRVREREGVSTHLDVLTSRQTLAISQRNYYSAIYAYREAWADLALAVGVVGEEKGLSAGGAGSGSGPSQKPGN